MFDDKKIVETVLAKETNPPLIYPNDLFLKSKWSIYFTGSCFFFCCFCVTNCLSWRQFLLLEQINRIENVQPTMGKKDEQCGGEKQKVSTPQRIIGKEKQKELCNAISALVAHITLEPLRTLNVQMAFSENEKSLCFCIVLVCVCVYFIGIVLSPHQLFLKYFFELHTLDSSLHTRCDAMPYTRLAETTESIVWQWTIVQCDNVVVRHWRFHGLSTQNRWWKKREIT